MSAVNTTPFTDAETKKYPKCTTILLMGETGVGKSLLINGLANYTKYKTLEEAMEDGVVMVQHTFLDHSNVFNGERVFAVPTVANTDEKGTSCLLEDGCSVSKGIRSYSFPIGNSSKTLRIIDTPGLGERVSLDEKYMDEIVSYVNRVDQIHAVCVVMRSSDSQANVVFRSTLSSIFSRLMPNVIKSNVFFVFTHARSTGYRPGRSLIYLKEWMEKNEKEGSVRSDKTFSFENNAVNFLYAMRENVVEDGCEAIEIYSKSWEEAVKETKRFVYRAASLSHMVKVFK